MKRANPINLNTRTYWNTVYGTPAKRETYAKTGTDGEHGLNPVPESKRFVTALEYVRDGDRVLDLGCGVGVFTELVKDTYLDCYVKGVDISTIAIEENEKRRKDIDYQAYVIGRDTLPDQPYDVVFSGETLEHLDDPADLFRDAERYLKPGGTLLITTPNGSAITTPEHTWIFTQEDIDQLYQEHGFRPPEFVYLPNLEHLLVIFAVGRKKR